MKKTLKIAALCGVLTLVLLATVSCSFDFGNLFGKHSHAFGDWATVKDATCTEKGLQERTCSCGEKEAQEINALGHTEVADAAVANTCTTDGLTAGSHCSTCGEVFTAQEVIPAEHNWMQLSLLEPATCFTYGEERRSCRVCGVAENAPVEPLEHNFVMNEETQLYSCTLCDGRIYAGHLYVVFEEEVHWFDAYKACEEKGGYLVTITSEGEQAIISSLMNSELRKKNEYFAGGIRLSDNQFHWITGEALEFRNWAPGEPNNGSGNQYFITIRSVLSNHITAAWDDCYYQTKAAFVCEWELDIADCEHIFTEWETITEATCWNDGEQSRFCTYCGEKETEVLPQLKHDFVVDEANGIEICEHCKAAKYNGHIYVLFMEECSWFDAYSRCKAIGGHLATITSEGEQTFVVSYRTFFKPTYNIWLGGYSDSEEWHWVTEETFEYTNWGSGEPSNSGGKEWAMHLYSVGSEAWNDMPLGEKYGYLCEFECEE